MYRIVRPWSLSSVLLSNLKELEVAEERVEMAISTMILFKLFVFHQNEDYEFKNMNYFFSNYVTNSFLDHGEVWWGLFRSYLSWRWRVVRIFKSRCGRATLLTLYISACQISSNQIHVRSNPLGLTNFLNRNLSQFLRTAIGSIFESFYQIPIRLCYQHRQLYP